MPIFGWVGRDERLVRGSARLSRLTRLVRLVRLAAPMGCSAPRREAPPQRIHAFGVKIVQAHAPGARELGERRRREARRVRMYRKCFFIVARIVGRHAVRRVGARGPRVVRRGGWLSHG